MISLIISVLCLVLGFAAGVYVTRKKSVKVNTPKS